MGSGLVVGLGYRGAWGAGVRVGLGLGARVGVRDGWVRAGVRVGVRDVPPRSSAPSTSLTAAEALVRVRVRVG